MTFNCQVDKASDWWTKNIGGIKMMGRKPKYLEKILSFAIWPPQIPHRMVWDLTCALEVTSWQPTWSHHHPRCGKLMNAKCVRSTNWYYTAANGQLYSCDTLFIWKMCISYKNDKISQVLKSEISRYFLCMLLN